LRSGAVSISDDLSEPVRVGSAAPWRSARGKGESRCVPAFSCEQRATKAGHVSTRLHHDRDVGQQGHLGHREGVIRDASIVVDGLLMPVLDAILAVDANGRRMVIPHEPAPQSVARLSEKP
jgi:hypothetical protein